MKLRYKLRILSRKIVQLYHEHTGRTSDITARYHVVKTCSYCPLANFFEGGGGVCGHPDAANLELPRFSTKPPPECPLLLYGRLLIDLDEKHSL